MAQIRLYCRPLLLYFVTALLLHGRMQAQQPAPSPVSPETSQSSTSTNSSGQGQPHPPPVSPANPAQSQTAPGQQPPDSQRSGSQPPDSQHPANHPAQEEVILKKEQSQRLFGIIPLFSVTSRKTAPPLTARQKFVLFAKSSADPYTFASSGIEAGIGQATNDFPGYGQGAAGYGKRFGASLADSVSGDFFGGFVYPVIFRQDPRYFRLGEGSLKRRFGYALAQEFTCRTDRGQRSFNWSSVLGSFSSGALANTYYPDKDRGVSLTLTRSAVSLLYASASGLISEFLPDVERKLFRKQPEPPSPSH
jgi:hypothetical protein